jgi:hypothetical protein
MRSSRPENGQIAYASRSPRHLRDVLDRAVLFCVENQQPDGVSQKLLNGAHQQRGFAAAGAAEDEHVLHKVFRCQ